MLSRLKLGLVTRLRLRLRQGLRLRQRQGLKLRLRQGLTRRRVPGLPVQALKGLLLLVSALHQCDRIPEAAAAWRPPPGTHGAGCAWSPTKCGAAGARLPLSVRPLQRERRRWRSV